MILSMGKLNILLISVFVHFATITKIQAAKLISTHGYDNCIELSNAACRVILEPNLGGRVLLYEIEGKNVLYVDPKQNGLKFTNQELESASNIQPCAGRFCVGPEKIFQMPKVFWLGHWDAKIIGNLKARMTSQVDKTTKLQLIRDFELNSKTSELKITQTIKNFGVKPQKLCFWSRTFAAGGGICIVPISNPNRFPNGYIEYGDGDVMQFAPESDKNIKIVDNHLLILGLKKASKFVFDSDKGWMGYITKDNLLFVKTYLYKKNYEYGEMTTAPLSIFYKTDILAELEPIGPWEWIKPNGKSSFSETWHLLPSKYPENKEVDITDMESIVNNLKK